MNIVIVGCGRVGAFLAGQLDKSGHHVTIVDLERASFVHLPRGFKGTTLLGNGTDMDVLRQAGTEKADALFGLTQGDNRNIMSSQIAQHVFGVKHVVTRIYDPLRSDTFAALGLQAISPTIIGANAFYEQLTGESAPKLAI